MEQAHYKRIRVKTDYIVILGRVSFRFLFRIRHHTIIHGLNAYLDVRAGVASTALGNGGSGGNGGNGGEDGRNALEISD